MQRRYDHRLQDLVRETGDLSIVTEVGVPRSTAAGWLRAEPHDVISLDQHPNEAWHVDTTVIRLLDGTRAYVYAVIDNFSRRILAFRVSKRFEVANTVAVLGEAASGTVGASVAGSAPMLVVDGGVENFNGGVDYLIEQGVLRRVLALTDLQFSNSLIEALWRLMKHQWLFLNTLDSVAAVRRHVSHYVTAHNNEIPHSAFRGQTRGRDVLRNGRAHSRAAGGHEQSREGGAACREPGSIMQRVPPPRWRE